MSPTTEPAPPGADVLPAIERLARLVHIDIPPLCLPGVAAALEGLEGHIRVLRAADEGQAG